MAILKIACIILGVLFLFLDLNAYIRQKLTDEMGLGWGGFSVFLILMGVFIGFCGKLSEPVFVIIMVCFGLVLFIMFFLCTAVSVLIMKNRELAMQVSLLNQENERIIHELGIVPNGGETKK